MDILEFVTEEQFLFIIITDCYCLINIMLFNIIAEHIQDNHAITISNTVSTRPGRQ